jgi:hypothetical protein
MSLAMDENELIISWMTFLEEATIKIEENFSKIEENIDKQ